MRGSSTPASCCELHEANPRALRRVTGVHWMFCCLFFAFTSVTASATQFEQLLRDLNISVSSSGIVPPRFNAPTLDGRRVGLRRLEGRVVLVNFWATWCRECLSEMPAFQRLHRELEHEGLSVLGVNYREGARQIARYAQRLNLTFPLLLDPYGRVKAAYGVIGLPTTFLIDRRGRTIGFAVGPRAWERAPARTVVKMLLAEYGMPKQQQ